MTNMDDDDANGEETRVTLTKHNPTSVSSSFGESGRALGDPSPRQSVKTDVVYCAGCQRPIYDKYYMWVDKRSWHEKCVQCSVCKQPLTDSCFTKNYKLYCQYDYKQLKQCRRCGGTLSCDDLVLREGEHSFHVKCFACIVCLRQLQPGDQYVLNDMCNQICCKSCLDRNDVMRRTSYCVQDDSASDSEKSDEEVFTGHPGNFGPGRVPCFTTPSGMQHLNMMGTNKNGSKTSPSMGMVTSASDAKRAKRPRTILTTAQRRKFKASFEVSQKPCRKVRETLAAETGLSPRVVQVWFQNQRAKMKKIARRQPQGDGSGQGARSGCRSRRKKTTDSDSENDLSSPGSYTSMPTPHQNSIYSDTYRSPGSIQTSPTASVSEGSTIPYYQPAAQIHEPGEFMYEDDLENALLPMEQSSSTYLTPPLHTVMSSDTTSSMNIGPRLQLNLASQVNDYNNNNNSGGIGGLGDNASAATLQDICQPYHPTGPMNAFPTAQVTSEGNPINKLMYMQNNFFRT